MASRGAIRSSSRRRRDGADASVPAGGSEEARGPSEEGPAAAAASGSAETIFSAAYRSRGGLPGRERPRGVSAPAREKEQLRRSPLVPPSAREAPEGAPEPTGSGTDVPAPTHAWEHPPEGGHVSMMSSFVEANGGRISRGSVSSTGSAEAIHGEAKEAEVSLKAQLASSRAEYARLFEQQAEIVELRSST